MCAGIDVGMSSLTMTNDRIWVLFARRVSGEITAAELLELAHLISKDPGHGYPMDILIHYFEATPAIDERDLIDRSERIWARLATTLMDDDCE